MDFMEMLDLDGENSYAQNKGEILVPNSERENITKNKLERIDFQDKEYINRIYENENEIKGEEFKDIKESLLEIGLINDVYIQLRDDGRYRIVSGLRRLLAIKEIYNETGNIVKSKDKLVVLPKDADKDLLDRISVDENQKRKNLTILELAYKFEIESQKKDVSIDELLEKYKISHTNFKRIKRAVSFPAELKLILNEIGIHRATSIFRINNILNENIEKTIAENKELSKRDLENKIKQLSQKSKENVFYNVKKIGATLDIRVKITDEIQEKINELVALVNNSPLKF